VGIEQHGSAGAALTLVKTAHVTGNVARGGIIEIEEQR
jgi:hypothetical protein